MIKKEVLLHVQPNVYTGIPTWHIWEQDMSAHGYFPVGLPIPLALLAPDPAEVTLLMIQGMQAQQGKLKEECAVQVANIEEQIQKLLCIEYKPVDVQRREGDSDE